MNLWLIFLLVAVVAMVLGPIMMLQPNAGQRVQEQLRQRAIELGLRVRIMSLPKQATDTETPAAISVYCLPNPQTMDITHCSEGLLLRTSYAHETHFLENWQWHGTAKASTREMEVLKRVLPQLPSSVSAVSFGAQGCCFYWSERGGAEMLERFLPLMQQIQSSRE